MTDSRSAAVLICIAMATAACTTGRVADDDRICSELSRFVAASSSVQTSSVVLRGGWGGDVKGVLMTHDCRVLGSSAGQRFCDYLVSDTSWEFGGNNLNRLSACLSDSAAAAALRRATDSSQPSVISTTISAASSGSAGLVMNYSPSSKSSGLYTLSIAVSHSGQ